MRFISIFTHEPLNRAPTQEEMAAMGKLVQEAMQEGWLIATEGVCFGENGFRVHKDARGKMPFSFRQCLLQVLKHMLH